MSGKDLEGNDRVEFRLASLEETRRFGRFVSKLIRHGDIILLSGDLGAGKTELARAIGTGLGLCPHDMTSPSFAIIHEFGEARIPLVHADLYRLGEEADIFETGLEEYMNGGFAVMIEWAEYLPKGTVTDALVITLEHMPGEDEEVRKAAVSLMGERWKDRLGDLLRFAQDTGR